MADDTDDLLDIRSVSMREACDLIPCSVYKLRELIDRGELESYIDGRMRVVTVRSIRARRDRLLNAGLPSTVIPERRHGRPRKPAAAPASAAESAAT